MHSRETDISDLDLLVLTMSLETYIKFGNKFDDEETFSINEPIAFGCLDKVEKRLLKFSNDEVHILHKSLTLHNERISFMATRTDDARNLEDIETQKESINLLLYAFNA